MTLSDASYYCAAAQPRRAQNEQDRNTKIVGVSILLEEMLRAARSRRPSLPEIVLWSTASQHPSESQTSECSDLLSRSRATCLIVAQRQPGKLTDQSSLKHARRSPENGTGTNRLLMVIRGRAWQVVLDEMLWPKPPKN